jgi:cyclophilin family peptidyl-prolyl cis-trans isomerase
MRKLILLLFLFAGCAKPEFKTRWISEKAPDVFTARFETSRGNFDVQITRELSPLAADRFYQLVKHSYFDNALFYRVVPNFVAQFGASDTTKISHWSKSKIPDEPVIGGNKRGTISFARSTKETRSGEMYINLRDNFRLDTINYGGVRGFPIIGHVSNGMEVVDSLYSGYSGSTMEKLEDLYRNRAGFLEKFPKLDSIKRAYLVKIRKE